MRFKDLTDKKIGSLTYIDFYHKGGRIFWSAACACGNVISVKSTRTARQKSCGCKRAESVAKFNATNKTTHGHTRSGKTTPEYRSWAGMFLRCNNKKSPAYRLYGARGIKICRRWSSFDNFLRDMGQKPRGKSLDRIDNNKGYSAQNCRWATNKEQGRNRRTCRFITAFGETKTITEWAEVTGIDRSTIAYRLNCGRSPEDSLRRST